MERSPCELACKTGNAAVQPRPRVAGAGEEVAGGGQNRSRRRHVTAATVGRPFQNLRFLRADTNGNPLEDNTRNDQGRRKNTNTVEIESEQARPLIDLIL
jgi:hypothetical protein